MEIILTIWIAGSSIQPWMRVPFDSYRDCRNAVEAVASVSGGERIAVQCHVDGVLRAAAGTDGFQPPGGWENKP